MILLYQNSLCDKMSTKNECQYHLKNLLSMFEDSNTSTSSTIFIRELLTRTSQCDEFYDLRKLRNAYMNKLYTLDTMSKKKDSDIVNRIIKMKNITPEDEKLGMVVVNHYSEWTQDQLIYSFTPYNWSKYQISYKYKRMIAIISNLFLGHKKYGLSARSAKTLTQNSMNWIKENKTEYKN